MQQLLLLSNLCSELPYWSCSECGLRMLPSLLFQVLFPNIIFVHLILPQYLLPREINKHNPTHQVVNNKQTVICSYNGTLLTLLTLKKKHSYHLNQSTDTKTNMNDSHRYFHEQKEPDTKEHIMCGSVNINFRKW